ncbi:MAG: hypothetical protein E7260_04705 [Lachnospiraceae bacterium]|nr:hypothetical protein [Lachnospiraceae bacterium]
MKHLRMIKIAAWGTFGIILIWLTIAGIYPALLSMLSVPEVNPAELPKEQEKQEVKEPEELLLTAVYERGDDGKFSGINIEVFHTGTKNAYYMEVPIHTKVTLSTELYKKLQAYSPELPQYFKLANMGEWFSEEYCLTGCNRILSEVLGVEIVHYIVADKDAMDSWSEGLLALTQKEEPPEEFFLKYNKWIEHTEADLTVEERWVYYESYKDIVLHEKEIVPGAEGMAEYLVTTGLTKLRLEELMERAQSLETE